MSRGHAITYRLSIVCTFCKFLRYAFATFARIMCHFSTNSEHSVFKNRRRLNVSIVSFRKSDRSAAVGGKELRSTRRYVITHVCD